MGAWGIGAFENDDASDWAYDLEESEDFAVLEQAFAVVQASKGPPESFECNAALAAAEVIAALRGKPLAELPNEIAEWVADRDAPPPALVAAARNAVARVGKQSELRELFADTEHFAAWQAAVADLQRRLA